MLTMPGGDRPMSVRRQRRLTTAVPARGRPPQREGLAMTNDEMTRLVTGATIHVIEAERLLAQVDTKDAGAWTEPLRAQVRRCAAEISVLSGLG